MDTRFIACEPNYMIPKDVTIDKIKEEANKKGALNYVTEQQVGDVNAMKEELRESFSFNHNDYLMCKWNQFLECMPKDVLVIKPYTEYKKKKNPVRRRILNGSFYSNCGKLMPVPNSKNQRTNAIYNPNF